MLQIKHVPRVLAIALIGTLTFPLFFSHAQATVPTTTIGRILLQVEDNGEAWYVDPIEQERLYVRDGEAAYAALHNFGLGITNGDLEMIPVGLEERFEESDFDGDGLGDRLEEGLGTDMHQIDSDGDGHTDYEEVLNGFDPLGPGALSTNTGLVNRLRGRIVLQVEELGQAWYIHPDDGKRYYMSTGDAAYQIMRYLSLGITNSDLSTIPIYSKEIDCGTSYSCFRGLIATDTPTSTRQTFSLEIFGGVVSGTSQLSHAFNESEGQYQYISESIEYYVDGLPYEETIPTSVCSHNDLHAMLHVIDELILGNWSTESMEFADCISL